MRARVAGCRVTLRCSMKKREPFAVFPDGSTREGHAWYLRYCTWWTGGRPKTGGVESLYHSE